MYALIEKNAFVRWVNLQRDYPNTSFPQPLTDASLPEGVVSVEMNNPPIPTRPLQTVERQDAPVLESGRWRLAYTVRDMTNEEAAQLTEAKKNEVRAERNRLIAESDWTQVADAPVDKAAWAAYRQVLRNITSQPGFPFEVQWPDTP